MEKQVKYLAIYNSVCVLYGPLSGISGQSTELPSSGNFISWQISNFYAQTWLEKWIFQAWLSMLCIH